MRAELGRIEAAVEGLRASASGFDDDRVLLRAAARSLMEVCESQVTACERVDETLTSMRRQLGATLETLRRVVVEAGPAPPERVPGTEPAGGRPERGARQQRRGRLRRFLGSGTELETAATARAGAGAGLAAYCLGSLRVVQNGELVTEWNGQKSQLLLSHLLVEHRRRMPREFLADLLWPDAEAEACRRNLHQAVYALRQTLRRREPDADYVVFRDETYFLNPEEDLWIDFVELEGRADAGRRLARAGDTQASARELEGAEALYAGDLFEDRLYEDHFRLLREHLRSVHLEVVAQVSDLQFEEARYADVIALNQRAVALDPYDEGAHRRLMEAYIAQGRRPMALRQYETCRAILSEELGLEPSEELRLLRAAI